MRVNFQQQYLNNQLNRIENTLGAENPSRTLKQFNLGQENRENTPRRGLENYLKYFLKSIKIP